jgi:hypothetical protein
VWEEEPRGPMTECPVCGGIYMEWLNHEDFEEVQL